MTDVPRVLWDKPVVRYARLTGEQRQAWEPVGVNLDVPPGRSASAYLDALMADDEAGMAAALETGEIAIADPGPAPHAVAVVDDSSADLDSGEPYASFFLLELDEQGAVADEWGAESIEDAMANAPAVDWQEVE